MKKLSIDDPYVSCAFLVFCEVNNHDRKHVMGDIPFTLKKRFNPLASDLGQYWLIAGNSDNYRARWKVMFSFYQGKYAWANGIWIRDTRIQLVGVEVSHRKRFERDMLHLRMMDVVQPFDMRAAQYHLPAFRP